MPVMQQLKIKKRRENWMNEWMKEIAKPLAVAASD